MCDVVLRPVSLAVLVHGGCGRCGFYGTVEISCFLADLEKRKAGSRVDGGWGRCIDFFTEKYLLATHYQVELS